MNEEFLASEPRFLPAILRPIASEANQTESALTSIRRRIIELDLAPGSRFTETQLADSLGMSKTPVREALVRLHHEGLVEPVRRAGYEVAPVTLRSTRDLCQFRSIVEPAAARLAAREMPASSARQHLALERLESLARHELATPYPSSPDGVESYLREHFEFQSIIVNLSGNDRLSAAVIGVLNDLERVLRLALGNLPWSDERANERIAIVDAISAHEEDEAYAAMLKRTQDAEQEILQALLQSSSIADAAIRVDR